MSEQNSDQKKNVSRRDFIVKGAAIGVGAAIAGSVPLGCEKQPKKIATRQGVPKTL